MENYDIEIIDKEILVKENIFPRYITIKCASCGHIWGVNTEWRANHSLTKKDLVCRECTFEKELFD